ncbi:SpoIID/LytB domain-containing protein, partial [Candidatus Aerophobetes bacterium]|nr:SpoIID/LytB domain-containing protein [Candidatus Aerophobetes bacterium]
MLVFFALCFILKGQCSAFLPPPDIQVKIAEGKSFIISATGLYRVENLKESRIFKQPCQVEETFGGIKINGKFWGESVKIEPEQNSFCEVNGKIYRGSLIIRKSKNSVEVLNTLSIEEYLYGIIKAEISPDWPLSTLCAQAIVARTYALRKLWEEESFPLTATSQHQVYAGVRGEDARGRIAIDLTRGEIVTFEGKPA